MTREEEIKSQADIYVGHPQDLGEDIGITKMRNAFIKGAKWADKTMIDKACKWLDANFPEIENIGSYYKKSFIEQFKKAMKE